jgi:glucose-6-phosphate isomerase
MPTTESVSFARNALTADALYYRHQFDLRAAFDRDPWRFQSFFLQAPGLCADLSKCMWDLAVLRHLMDLARAAGLEERRTAMFAGEAVNSTEGRAVLHPALRSAVAAHEPGEEPDALAADVMAMLDVAEAIRANPDIHDVVHIGIGGSSLGPELLCQALSDLADTEVRVHFVSNIDGHQISSVLANLSAAHTLFIVASKSFSTLETLRNTQTAIAWFEQSQPGRPTQPHFVAITSQSQKARDMGFGVILGMPEGVGGRFSLWSAIGLPIAVAVGREHFLSLLEGAAAMDEHFAQTPMERNLPVWLGLLDVWNSSFLQYASRCVVPYHFGLRRLPAYLQQLDMESNGKRVQLDGSPVQGSTGMCVWGEVGSDSQHAFFQWLHQGSQTTPVEFIAVRQPSHNLPGHHRSLLANAVAQAQALMCGQVAQDVGGLSGHQDFPGNKPSAFFVLEKLAPFAVGAFLALQEHRVFVAGTVWGINSFDQWGVELGKVLARDIEDRLGSGQTDGLDGSTGGLVRLLAGVPACCEG